MSKTLILTSLVALTLAVSGCSWVNKEIHGNKAAPMPAAAMAAPVVSPDTLKQVQSKLHDANFYHGDIDGIWGPASKAALHDFQVKHDIAPTGELDHPTLAALDLH